MPVFLAFLAAVLPDLVKAALDHLGKGAPAQAESPVPDKIKAIVHPAVMAAFEELKKPFPSWAWPALDDCEAEAELQIEQAVMKLNL